jgi:hypothetical protein
MDHLPLFPHPEGQIKSGMEFSSGALASRLATPAGHGDQGADEERFLVEQLGQAGARLAFLGG